MTDSDWYIQIARTCYYARRHSAGCPLVVFGMLVIFTDADPWFQPEAQNDNGFDEYA